jgi:hypothetical protein
VNREKRREIVPASVKPVRQKTQYTCMATSIAMALGALGSSVTEEDVNKVLKCRPKQGATWEDALACIQYFGMKGTLVSPSSITELKRWTDQGFPVVISWNPEGRPWNHASTVYGVSENEELVFIADPNIPDPKKLVRLVSADNFYDTWKEDWGDYLVRRPALMIQPEIDQNGRSILAGATMKGKYTPSEISKIEKHWELAEYDKLADMGVISRTLANKAMKYMKDLKSGGSLRGTSDDPTIKIDDKVMALTDQYHNGIFKRSSQTDFRRRALANHQVKKKKDEFPPSEVGEETPPIKMESDEPYMKGNFNQEEFHEMSDHFHKKSFRERALSNYQAKKKKAQVEVVAEQTEDFSKEAEILADVKKKARLLVKNAFIQDDEVMLFLATHAEKAHNKEASILADSIKELRTINSRLASKKDGLYGYHPKTAKLGLALCNEFTHYTTQKLAGLSGSEFFAKKASTEKCAYSEFINRCFG